MRLKSAFLRPVTLIAISGLAFLTPMAKAVTMDASVSAFIDSAFNPSESIGCGDSGGDSGPFVTLSVFCSIAVFPAFANVGVEASGDDIAGSAVLRQDTSGTFDGFNTPAFTAFSVTARGAIYISAPSSPTVDITFLGQTCAIEFCSLDMGINGDFASGSRDFPSLTFTGVTANRQLPYFFRGGGENVDFGQFGGGVDFFDYNLRWADIRDHETGQELADAQLLFGPESTIPEPTTGTLCLLCFVTLGILLHRRHAA